MGCIPSKRQLDYKEDLKDSYKDNNLTNEASLSTTKFLNEAEMQGYERRPLMDQEITQLPHCLIGQLHAEFLSDNAKTGAALDGTACMISPNLILTAAHNVFYQHFTRKTPIQCSFTLGLHKNKGKITNVIDYRYPKAFKGASDNSQSCRKYDYALLKIQPIFNESELENLKFMDLSTDNVSVGQEVQIFGYAIDKNKSMNPIYSKDCSSTINMQFGASGNVCQSNHMFISYAISTSAGQSGSPVIYKRYKDNKFQYEIVGVHKGTDLRSHKTINYAVSASIEMKKNIKQWQLEFNLGAVIIDQGQYIGELSNGLAQGKGVLTLTNGDKYQGYFSKNKINGQGSCEYNNGDRFKGQYKDGQRHGKGILQYADGSKFEGEYKHDKRNGKGTQYQVNGDKFEGEYQNDLIKGMGIQYYANGNKFQGEFQNGQRNGYGIQSFAEGKFQGNFVHGKRDGQGSEYFTNGSKFEGQFKNNLRNGYGVQISANGDKFEGDFKEGLREGKGIDYFVNGDMFQGEFSEGMRKGQGTQSFNNGNTYIGEFQANKKHGKGIYTGENGYKFKGQYVEGKKNGKGIQYFANGNKFQGYFKNNRKHGKGMFYSANDDRFEGQFKEGQKNGKGIDYFANGDKFQGEFKDGMRNGQGIQSFANGDKYEGIFQDGQRNGKGTFYSRNGDIFQEEYVDGKIIGQDVLKPGVLIPHPIKAKYKRDIKNSGSILQKQIYSELTFNKSITFNSFKKNNSSIAFSPKT